MRGIRVAGKDAEDFLHRVTSGRVKGLKEGEGARGLLLNGKSRIIAQFDLLRFEAGNFLLVAPEPCSAALQKGLEQLHFSEELEIREEGAFHLRAGSLQGGRLFSFAGKDPVWPAPVPGYECVSGKGDFPPGWSFDRIGSLVPWPPSDWGEGTPALEAGLLPWIDRSKGCYPGQEVVELSLNVGHPARVLVAIEGDNAPAERIPLEGGGEAVVTSRAERDGKFRALVRVPWGKRGAIPGFRILKGWELD